MEPLRILQVEDDKFFQEIVADIFKDVNASLTQIVSLSAIAPVVQKEKFDVAIIDGKFFDIPNWIVSFHLPAAYDIIKNTGIKAIYVLSGEKLTYIQSELWPDRVPDGIFDKPQAYQLWAIILDRFKDVLQHNLAELN